MFSKFSIKYMFWYSDRYALNTNHVWRTDIKFNLFNCVDIVPGLYVIMDMVKVHIAF